MTETNPWYKETHTRNIKETAEEEWFCKYRSNVQSLGYGLEVPGFDSRHDQ